LGYIAVHPDAVCRRKHGLSLIEVLAAIAIISLLLGMLVPTVSLIYRAVESLRFKVSSSAIVHDVIPVKYTADGQDISPPLSWTVVASGARSIVVLMLDDGRGPRTCDWIVFNLSPRLNGLPEGFDVAAAGAIEGRNDLGLVGYTGPAPKPGLVHQYHFEVYTLDTKLDVGPAPSYAVIQARMNGHVIQGGDLQGAYSR
jgi:Raf kinase inhibitor-like YbhB/YbcL family protein